MSQSSDTICIAVVREGPLETHLSETPEAVAGQRKRLAAVSSVLADQSLFPSLFKVRCKDDRLQDEKAHEVANIFLDPTFQDVLNQTSELGKEVIHEILVDGLAEATLASVSAIGLLASQLLKRVRAGDIKSFVLFKGGKAIFDSTQVSGLRG